VLAVVCLSVILLSPDADAQPTTDDQIMTCDFAMPEEVANSVKTMKDKLTAVKRQLADCGCDSAKSTTVNPIDYSTQST